ncbi:MULTISPECIES: ABC transporter permease [Chelativorans]|jgi:peptide/nickel transport system permease protein|uniref:Binding-protein-dependent transport systems inner membrane component n=1 Tax=Chelativorans sp. (strain BNC1) TaxID=266779 RepID=Q11GY0_CHESB|nr:MULTISPECIES: ABC transporter permease [Chelativorans]
MYLTQPIPASPASTGARIKAYFAQTRLSLLVRSPIALISALVLIALVLIALIGAPLALETANFQSLRLRFFPPFSLEHGWIYVLGADGLGRSMLAQLIVGARTSFIVAGAAVGLAAVVGTSIGMISGFVGGWVDAALMRVSDIIVTVPSLLLALAVLFVLEPSIFNLVAVLAVSRLPIYLRVARAQTLELRERVFVEASRAIGATNLRIIWRDIRPLVLPTVMTVSMLELASVMLAAAGLSFLGVGLQRPDVDWGTIVSEGREYLTRAWWATVFPGMAIVITALAANFLSNWLRASGDPLQAGALAAATARQEDALK